MRDAGLDPIVAIGGAPGILPIPTIADRYPGEGPLGALATATTFAKTGWVLTATCDLALLEPATVAALLAAVDDVDSGNAVVAGIEGVAQVSLGCWPAAWSRQLHAAIRTGERRFRHALTVGPVRTVEVEPRHLLDADDEATLAALRNGEPNMADPTSPGA